MHWKRQEGMEFCGTGRNKCICNWCDMQREDAYFSGHLVCHIFGLACVLMLRPISPKLVLFTDVWVSTIPRNFNFNTLLLSIHVSGYFSYLSFLIVLFIGWLLFHSLEKHEYLQIERKRRRSDPVLWQNPLYQQKIRNQRTTHTNATKNFDYTTIADRLMTVSWSNK